MMISGLVRSSTIDFPGQIAAVIFTPGCNMDCFYCHNRTLLTGDAPHLDAQEVLAFLKKRRGLLEGVVFSGGEPTLQPDLADWIRLVRDLGYKIKLDTNGARPPVLRHLLDQGLLDYVAIDCKAPWSRYPEICGCPDGTAADVRHAMQMVHEAGVAWEIRTTVIPQLSVKDLAIMMQSVPPAPLYALQRYNRPAQYRPEDRFRLQAEGYTPAQLVLMAEQLREYQANIIIRS